MSLRNLSVGIKQIWTKLVLEFRLKWEFSDFDYSPLSGVILPSEKYSDGGLVEILEFVFCF